MLDRNDDEFPEDSLFIINGATVRDDNGVWKKCEWLFKDVGIDATFENLQLGSGDQGAIPAEPEEDLVNAFDAMSAIKSTEPEERSKPGQIEVRLDRVTMGKTVNKKRSVSPDDKGKLAELQGSEIGDLGHTVGRTEGEALGERTQVTYFKHMNDKNKPYAIFRFNYCHESMFISHHFIC
jgi:hypothetical protein